MAEQISKERLKQLQAIGAVKRTKTLSLPIKEDKKPVAQPDKPESTAIDATLDVMNKLTSELVELSTKQAEKIAVIFLRQEQAHRAEIAEIIAEINKPKTAIVHRETTGDRLISKIDFEVKGE